MAASVISWRTAAAGSLASRYARASPNIVAAPALLLAEVAGAVSRRTGRDPEQRSAGHGDDRDEQRQAIQRCVGTRDTD